ncbi:hypothetical protein ACFX1R_032781 [Malus domestica]
MQDYRTTPVGLSERVQIQRDEQSPKTPLSQNAPFREEKTSRWVVFFLGHVASFREVAAEARAKLAEFAKHSLNHLPETSSQRRFGIAMGVVEAMQHSKSSRRIAQLNGSHSEGR